MKKLLSLCLVSIFLLIDTSFADLSVGTSTNEPTHISVGTFSIHKISVGVPTNTNTIQTTFVARSNGSFQYNKSRDDRVDWRGSTVPDDTERYIVSFAFFPGTHPSRPNSYYLNLNQAVFQTYAAPTPPTLEVNGNSYTMSVVGNITNSSGPNFRRYQTAVITRAADRVTASNLTNSYKVRFPGGEYLTFGDAGIVWESSNPPAITAFSVAPTTIDLDTRATGTITFTLGVTGRAGQVTNAHIVREPEGVNVGTSFTAGAGANISTTLPNITQPQKTTTYRLIASNSGGSSHRDTTVTVTKNPALSNLRRTRYIDATKLYEFAFTVEGLPRPTVTYVFSGGQQGTVNSRHFTQGSNPYTWNVSGWRIVFANANAQSLVLTATNASGTATARLANIND